VLILFTTIEQDLNYYWMWR